MERAQLPGVARQESEGVGTAAGPSPPELAAPLKLVIWDLDEVLWKGVLSESEVELEESHGEVVRELNRRGIVNSICSKNDLHDARARLQREGLWEEFVFASIDWSPKGPRIAQLVDDMRLRAVNVLFIDDNLSNLHEAQHYVPGLQVHEPSVIADLLSLPQAQGKDDRARSRLAHYRVLESKVADRAESAASNEEFLRSCNISVELLDVREQELARVLELVNRSNQLNFTKSRLSEPQLRAMVNQDGRTTQCVRVRDRYGDYGLSGFYSMHDGRVSDFVFSCRILHMGVEQWLYARLGKPQLEIVGDVASSLDGCEDVDWIALADAPRSSSGDPLPASRARSSRVLLKGGCDMWTLNQFLGGRVRTEFTHLSATGAEVHAENTEILRRSSRETLAQFGTVIDRLPFLDRAAYMSRIARAPKSIGTMILSVLMDYSQGIYRLRGTDFAVPFWQYERDATDPAQWSYLEQRWGDVGIDAAFLRWFAERFEFQGPLTDERFKENIRWLAGRLPRSSRLILLNGAEVPIEHELEPGRHVRHEHMNAALEEVVAELPNAAICDVRPFVTSAEDLADNLRHYKRQPYLGIAEHLATLVGSDLSIEQRELARRVQRARRRIMREADRVLLRLRVR